MSAKRGLGAGLGGLLDATERPRPAGLREVAVATILANPHQPRARFDPAALQELAASIRQYGVLQPLIVTALSGGDYQLIAGERRWRAAQLAGLATVPVIVKQATAQEQLELALIENIQRADLDVLEEAQAYQSLAVEFQLTQEQIAERVGKSRATITQTLGVLRLPEAVQSELAAGRLKLGHVRPLVALNDPALQTSTAAQIVARELTVRQAEALVATLRPAPPPYARRPSLAAAEPAADQVVVTNLQERLGIAVELQRRGRGGRLILSFDSEATLEKLYEVLAGSE